MKNKTRNQEITLMIIGGLGNQLFQYCKLNQFKKAGYKVIVDTSNNQKFKNHHLITFREVAFDPQLFEFDKISENKLFFINLLERINKNKFLPSLNFIYKEINDDNFRKLKFKKYNKMIGYWQDVENLIIEKEFLIRSLSKHPLLSEAFNKSIKKGSSILHIRRGDYLKIDENLSNSFYLEALNYCEKHIDSFEFEIFTDDYSWVKKQKIFHNASKVHKNLNTKESDIIAFASMLNFENYIVGNSTFSLIPAVLSESKESKILVAEPWFRNKNKKLNVPNNWIKINNSKD